MLIMVPFQIAKVSTLFCTDIADLLSFYIEQTCRSYTILFCGPRDDLSFNTAGGFLCFYSIVIKIFIVHLFVCTVNCLDQAKASIACYHIFN